MKFSLKFIGFFLAFLILVFIFAPKLYFNLNLFLEKQALKPPNIPIDKNVKGLSIGENGWVKYPQDYTLVLVGDSMTERLGNSDELRGFLKEYYPNESFEVLNYGFGSTNILSVQERLEKETFFNRTFRPILDIDFDLILIESFGYNPLSELPLEEGLKKQKETLNIIVGKVKMTHPKAKIVFVATIAPNKETFALGEKDLSLGERIKWTEERIAYIKNHIKYANANNIPLINIFDKSLDDLGNGKSIYISNEDHIHPSPTGVVFISKEIANFLYKYQVL